MNLPLVPADWKMPWQDEILRAFEDLELPSEDGVPLETDWHRIEINLLAESVKSHYAGREDYYAGGNMFIHYSVQKARNRDFLGPDFFFAWGRPLTPPRPYWAAWDEDGKLPDVIVELSSPTTRETDHTTKFEIYEQTFKTSEYFLYDPDTQVLEGYRLGLKQTYEPIAADAEGRLWSEQLRLFLGLWRGPYQRFDVTWLRLFTTDGQLVQTGEERAEAERQRAEAERQRAEAERQRAEAAEAELARLRALLSRTGQSNTPNGD